MPPPHSDPVIAMILLKNGKRTKWLAYFDVTWRFMDSKPCVVTWWHPFPDDPPDK